MAVFFIWRRSLPKLFSDDEEVVDGATRLGYLLAVTVFFSSIGPVLSGMAVGAGWQLQVACVNIGCYYLVGIPVGVLLGFKLRLGALGVWTGMLTGTLLQMAIVLAIITRTEWEKQAVLTLTARLSHIRSKKEQLYDLIAECEKKYPKSAPHNIQLLEHISKQIQPRA